MADVAVQDGRIAAVGPKLGKGRREIDAAGLMVTPGFVDIHTHYDGQATWDPFVTPSSWHGVTTTVFGNCGVGFAPVRPGKSPYLINLMEGVEDIPGTVLNEGVKFDWESFPDYLDTLASMRRAVDVAAQLPHGALRFYVMGDRGADHAEVPSEREIEEMARLTEEALRAGAMGFTTSRTTKHKAKDGRFTPSLSAREAELLGIAAGMKRAGRGVLQVNSDFGPGEFEALEAASALAGRPLSCLLVQVDAQPKLWRETLDQIHGVRQAGRLANAQVGSRPIGVIMGLETTAHPFAAHPAWLEMRKLSPAERYQRLVVDADLRRRLVEEPSGASGLHGRVVPQDVSGRRQARLRTRRRQLDCRHRQAQRPHAAGRGARRADVARWQGPADAAVRELRLRQPRRGARDDHRSGDGAGRGRRRRPCRRDLRCLLADLAADAVGPRPHARTEAAAGIPGRQADARHGARPTGSAIAACWRRATRPTST